MTASSLIDKTAPVRAGEELDIAKLEPYLREALGIAGGEFSVEQFPGGHSNLTYAVNIADKEFVLRRPPFGSQVKSEHDMGCEYNILPPIYHAYGTAPEPHLYCEDESQLRAQFYSMSRRQGVTLC